MNRERTRARLLAWAARLGPFWYVIPSAMIVLAGLATCNVFDVPDPDRFEVIATSPHPQGTRAAIVTRQRHADTGDTFLCVWIVAPPFPAPGPTRRLGKDCVIVASAPEQPLTLNWTRSGRLGVSTGEQDTVTEVPAGDASCYFAPKTGTRNICTARGIVETGNRR